MDHGSLASCFAINNTAGSPMRQRTRAALGEYEAELGREHTNRVAGYAGIQPAKVKWQ